MKEGLTLREFTAEMQAIGFQVHDTQSTDESVIIFTRFSGGTKFGIILPSQTIRGRHIFAQFVTAYTDRPGLDQVNRYNSEYRWPRVYLDDDGELVLDMVFPLVGIDRAYLESMFMLWEAAVQSVIDCDYLNG